MNKKELVKSKSPKIKKTYNLNLEKKSIPKTDIISEFEFISELQNTLKNNSTIITLNDLLNYNFALDDSKNLNTTSSTNLVGKRPSTNQDEKCDLVLKDVEEDIEKENSDYLSGLCDEFTKTERIKRSDLFLSKQIPLSNYVIKINENKKELKHISKMNKDELMQTKLIYKQQYEINLEKIKKYENYIKLSEIKQIYNNVDNINEKNIKIILDKIMNYLNIKKVPKGNFDEILDIIYNLISYEIKHKYTEQVIKNS